MVYFTSNKSALLQRPLEMISLLKTAPRHYGNNISGKVTEVLKHGVNAKSVPSTVFPQTSFLTICELHSRNSRRPFIGD